MKFKMIQILSSVCGLVCLLLSGSAFAGGFALPLGVEWCEERSVVESKMDSPREAADDVVESTARVWRVDGFLSAIFDADKLVKMSVRSYETEKHVARTRAALKKMLGDGVSKGEKVRWSPEGKGTVQFKVQTEQVYVTFEAPTGICGGGAVQEKTLSEREKADLEATKRSQAIEWDPYADEGFEDEPVVKRKKKEEPKKEEKEEEEEDELEDEDIDW
jgi:hypothetical protein